MLGTRRGERGEGRTGSIVSLILLAAVIYAAWNVAPVYIDHYGFTDKVVEICRTPKYRAPTDERILDMLIKEVRERRLETWITRASFRVSTTDTSRRIQLYYERQAKVLPGWTRVFKFEFQADQPLI
jgi:hypothetical protein